MGQGSPFQGNVYVRGSPHKLGEPVVARNLTALGGQAGSRLDLADQLISDDKPTRIPRDGEPCMVAIFWAGNCPDSR